jgi:hypothetical protein
VCWIEPVTVADVGTIGDEWLDVTALMVIGKTVK